MYSKARHGTTLSDGEVVSTVAQPEVVHASAALLELDSIHQIFTFDQGEIEALHLFLGRIMPAS